MPFAARQLHTPPPALPPYGTTLCTEEEQRVWKVRAPSVGLSSSDVY